MWRSVGLPISLAVGAALGAAVLAAAAPETPPPVSSLFAQRWSAGVSAGEPAFQTQAIDADTFAIRQSIRTSFEAPFLYLLFGSDRALLIDSGAEGASAKSEVDRVITAWLRKNRRASIPLVVMHSHSHGDHVAGDAEFAARADTVVVGRSPEQVAAFFGIADWPFGAAAFDLGGRLVDVLPAPGHHPSHVAVFDRRTRALFTGDTVYPGRLYFQCGKAAEFRATIERLARFAAANNARWLLGAHIEMRASPGESFQAEDRARRDEHLLELPPSILGQISAGLAKMEGRPRVETHPEFVLFPHPADPRGKTPPNWCDGEPKA